jgi:hypothetical protein
MRDCHELFQTLGADELDPLIPAYPLLVDYWGKVIGDNYDVIADESKVLAKGRGQLLAMSDPHLKPVSAGYDRRRLEFPFKVSDIIAVDSTACRQVQLADILSGAIASAAKASTKVALKSGTFAHDVSPLCFSKRLIIDHLWPSREIDPSNLGTDIAPGPNDVDLATYTAMILKGHPSTKNSNP